MTAEPAELVAVWGGETLRFSVIRSRRRTLEINISRDGLVTVRVPLRASESRIIAAVLERGGWIVRKLRELENRPKVPVYRYVSGESHRYLGGSIRLQVTAGAVPDIRLSGSTLHLKVPERSTRTQRQALVAHWFSLQCHRLFPERLDIQFPPFKALGVKRPPLIIRPMTRQWGSYTAQGKVSLNTALIYADLQLIDYVVVHELAHAVHPNHGKHWQTLMTRMMPDWRERRHELNQMVI